jgi:hypothetical protein
LTKKNEVNKKKNNNFFLTKRNIDKYEDMAGWLAWYSDCIKVLKIQLTPSSFEITGIIYKILCNLL